MKIETKHNIQNRIKSLDTEWCSIGASIAQLQAKRKKVEDKIKRYERLIK